MGYRNLVKSARRVVPYFQHPADPPKRCVEPLIYGENILNDPSFERQAGITGGPIPNSIPEDGLTGTTSCQTGAKWIAPEGLNVYDVLNHEVLIVTSDSAKQITEALKPKAAGGES